MFEAVGQSRFPRNIMTFDYSGFFQVSSLEQIIEAFEMAQFKDCIQVNQRPHGTFLSAFSVVCTSTELLYALILILDLVTPGISTTTFTSLSVVVTSASGSPSDEIIGALLKNLHPNRTRI